ncbi:MAG: helix-turn-helix domain-containing protein [Thermoplasmatales archaeon]|nr:helix-turn-helix domain-containing protein [Thermoplasmatales archaeon]
MLVLLNFSARLTVGQEPSDNLSPSYYKVEPIKTFDITEIPTVSINDYTRINDTFVLDFNVTNVRELPEGSIAVELPNDRIGIKLANGSTNVLPVGSTIVERASDEITAIFSNWTKAVISVKNQSAIIGVPEVVKIPIEDAMTKAKFSQSIDNLDAYKVTMVSTELQKTELQENIISYSVDWGDGTMGTYNASRAAISHTYKHSGTYVQTFTITDCFGMTYTFEKNYTVHYEGHLSHTYLLLKEYKGPIATTASAGIGATLLGLVAFTETGKYKFLAFLSLLMPLYTRIQKEDVLDQFVRGQIYGYIRTNPGVHYNQIRRGIDIKNGTLSYHLRVLEKTELIKSRREGVRYRAFYPSGIRFPKEERYRLTELQTEILEVIKKHDGIKQKEIAKILHKKPQVINYNVKVLRQADLINVRKIGRKTLCYYNESFDTEGFGE